MSALACILDRRGSRLKPRRLERIGAALGIYGGTSSFFHDGPVGIVVRHAAEASSMHRHGPIRDHRTGLVVAVAGRFGLSSVESRDLADPAEIGFARWVLERWPEQGSRCLDKISGPFTILVAEPEAGRVQVLRDHLGEIEVCYHLDHRELLVATEAGAVIADPSVDRSLNKEAAARFLGFRFGHFEDGFFRGVRELAPAHELRVSREDLVIERYWKIGNHRETPSLETASAVFRDRLRAAIRTGIVGRTPSEVGLSLSGGLDSTAIAALAPQEVRSYSWFFEEVPDQTERSNIEAVSECLGTPVNWVCGDGCEPLSGDFVPDFVHASSPYVNAFAALKSRLYEAARHDGCRRMIVGDGGDALYGAGVYWLRDGLVQLRPWAVPNLGRALISAISGDSWSRRTLRAATPIRAGVRQRRFGLRPRWMTDEGASLLPREALSPVLPEGRPSGRFDLAVGARNIELEREERRLFHQCGVERANPFWDRFLLETVLGWPAYLLHRGDRNKLLTREALRDLLPQQVLTCGRIGLLGEFFLRGIDRQREFISDLVFRRPRSDCWRYVRRDWLEPYLTNTDEIAFGHTILWRVICYELWVRKVWDAA